VKVYDQYKVDVPEGKIGDWEVNKFTVPKNDPSTLSYAFHGRPVAPGDYTRLIQIGGYHPMMSDTPAEICDCLGFIVHASGRCLVNGLGLGVVLKALIAKPKVTHIDVVEIEQDIIDLVWPTYADGDRITLHHADAFTIQWPKGKRWHCAWHDIWRDIATDNLEGIAKLKRKYGHRVDWQLAWVEGELRRTRRRFGKGGLY